MDILIYSGAGDALGLGLILQREGHTVTMYVEREDSHRVGDGLLPKTQDGVDFARNHADLVLFDAVGFGGIADSLRDHGVAVVGASRALDLLELDRLKAMDIFRGLGIRVPESEEFPDGNLDRAIAWIHKHPGRYVWKPNGNLGTDKTFIAEDAEEMALYLEHAADQIRGEDSGIPPFLLQAFVDGAEVSTERFYAQGEPVRALDSSTLEAKKLLAGDLGPATGCYSEDTEILSEHGWRRQETLAIGDRVLTMDARTREARYDAITAVWRYAWDGPAVSFCGRSVDLLVTPDHAMILDGGKTLKRKRADKVISTQSSHFFIPKGSAWSGADVEHFLLPASHHPWPHPWSQTPGAQAMRQTRAAQQPGPKAVVRDYPALSLPMDDWLAFFGLYLAEGCVKPRYGEVSISQKTADPAMAALLTRLPWKWRRDRSSWTAYSPQLAAHLRPLGHSHQKRIPRDYLRLGSRQLAILLDWMMRGDGSVSAQGQATYYTASKELADDVQELAQKIGRGATIRVRDRRGTAITARRVPIRPGIVRHLSYEVSIYRRPYRCMLRKLTRRTVDYAGTMWCVTVPSGIIYVRRNGKAAWCGNCAGNVVLDPHPSLLRDTVDRLDRFAAEHHISGPIDLNALVEQTTRRPLVIEATARFGWHALQAFIARWGMPVGETLDAIAHGEMPAVRFMAPVGAALPVAIPPYPNEGAAKARGMPIVDDVEEDPAVWLGDVMRDPETDRLVCAGSDGVVYIRTATAATAADAYAQVYRALADSRLPDRGWRSDLVEFTARKLKHLRSLGVTLRG